MTSIKSISLYDTSNYRGSGLVLVGVAAIRTRPDPVRLGAVNGPLEAVSKPLDDL